MKAKSKNDDFIVAPSAQHTSQYVSSRGANTSSLPVLSTKKEGVLTQHTGNDLRALACRWIKIEISGLSAHTIEARARDLKKFLMFYEHLNANYSASELTPRDVKMFIDETCRQGYALSSCNRFLGTIRAFGNWLYNDLKVTEVNPTKGIREFNLPEITPRTIDDKTWHRLKKSGDKLVRQKGNAIAVRDRALMEVLNSSSARISEVLNCKLDQIVGKVLKNVVCKGGVIRNIKLKKEAMLLLTDYIKSYRKSETDFIFVTKNGNQLDRVNAWKSIKRIAKFAAVNHGDDEIASTSCHSYRHRGAFKVYELTRDLLAVKRKLGHRSTRHLEIYCLSPDVDRKEDQVLEQI